MPGTLSVASITSVTSFANTSFLPVSSVATKEFVHTASIGACQNNYVISGMSTKNNVVTIVNLNPTNTIILSGIHSDGIDVGKNIILRNNTWPQANESYLIILNRNDMDSSNANHIHWNDWTMPGFIPPGEEMKLVYNGNRWEVMGGTRFGGGVAIWDYKDHVETYNSGGSGASTTMYSRVLEITGYKSIPCDVLVVTSSQSYRYAVSSYSPHFIPGIRWGLYTGYFKYVRDSAPPDNITRWFMGFNTHVGPNYSFTNANNPVRIVGVMHDNTGTRFVTTNASSTLANDRSQQSSTGITTVANTVYRFFAFINGAGKRADFCMANTGNDLSTWHKNIITHANTQCIPYDSGGAMNIGTVLVKDTGSDTANQARLHFTQTMMGGAGVQV